jgi:hypothetical protein
MKELTVQHVKSGQKGFFQHVILKLPILRELPSKSEVVPVRPAAVAVAVAAATKY